MTDVPTPFRRTAILGHRPCAGRAALRGGLGGAILLVLAACGGSAATATDPAGTTTALPGAESSAAESSAAETSAAETSASPSGEAALSETPGSSAPAADAPGPLTKADIQASKEVVHEFARRGVAGDYAGVCALTMGDDRMPLTPVQVDECARELERTASARPLPPEAVDALAPDKLEARDNGDGTVAITQIATGTEFSSVIAKGADGKMYIADAR